MSRSLAALLWDVDGTLAETEFEGHLPAFNQAFAEAGEACRWDAPTYRRLLAVSGGRERLRYWFLEQEGVEPRPERLEALALAKQRHYAGRVRSGALPLRPGVERLIGEAAAAGLVQAIVTTSGRAAVEALAAGSLAPVAGTFSVWICGEDVAAKKPDPEAYRQALSRLELDPAVVLAIEDSHNGLSAARAAGLSCLVTLSSLSRHEDPARFGEALAVVADLEGGADPDGGPSLAASAQEPVTLAWLQRRMACP